MGGSSWFSYYFESLSLFLAALPRNPIERTQCLTVSFAKIRDQLGFEPMISVEQGIVEVRDALQQGIVKDLFSSRHRNANFIVQ